MFAEILPESVSPGIAGLFLVVSLLTSMITAAVGAGGGVFLLLIISLWLPPAAVIPVHGLVQAGSNLGRAGMAWRHIHWPTVGWFLPGVVCGMALGAAVLMRLPEAWWQLIIALFVLYLCWGPSLPKRAVGRGGIALVGAVTSFITLFVGASGPLVASYLKQIHRDRFTTVATFATAMVLQHGPKVAIFAVTGFAFREWLPLILAMIAAGALGTWCGLKLLGKLSDGRFRQLFNIFLTLLALRLLWLAARGFGLVPT